MEVNCAKSMALDLLGGKLRFSFLLSLLLPPCRLVICHPRSLSRRVCLTCHTVVAAFSLWLLGFRRDDANLPTFGPTYAFAFWFWAAAAAAAAVAAAAVAADADWFGRSLGGK